MNFRTAYNVEILAKFVARRTIHYRKSARFNKTVICQDSHRATWKKRKDPHAFGSKLALFKRERPPPWCGL